MTLSFTAWTPADVEEIQAFNARMAEAGYIFPRDSGDLMLPGPPGSPLEIKLFVARVDGVLRGGYALKVETFCTPDSDRGVANLQIPLTEGYIDKRYAALGASIPRDALVRNKYIYCLGMGGLYRPLPKMLQQLRWRLELVPFYFRVVRAGGFLREIRFLRSRRLTALACDIACYTGVGAAGVMIWNALHSVPRMTEGSSLKMLRIDSFDERADALQRDVRHEYGGFCSRSSAALNQRFPVHDPRLMRFYVFEKGRLIGWLALSSNQLENHKQFGSMRLGCIVDGLCRLADVPRLVAAATRALVDLDVDVIVTNQSHRCWIQALRGGGYLSGPSNFALATSPALTQVAPDLATLHFNRGDGDGPINL